MDGCLSLILLPKLERSQAVISNYYAPLDLLEYGPA